MPEHVKYKLQLITYINSNMAWAHIYTFWLKELPVNHMELDITIKLSYEVNKLMK